MIKILVDKAVGERDNERNPEASVSKWLESEVFRAVEEIKQSHHK